MRKILFAAILWMASVVCASATNVTVEMNAVSTTMSVSEALTGTPVAVGAPSGKVYNFTAAPGTYVLTAYDTDGKTVNGTIELVISGDSVSFNLQTVTLSFFNEGFVYGTDVTLELNLKDANGVDYDVTIGDSKTAGKKTFLVFKNSTSNIDATPSEARAAEGFLPWQDTRNRKYKSNSTISVALAQNRDYTITVPASAQAQLATKTKDYVPFTAIEPDSIITNGENKVYHYGMNLTSSSSTLMFRIWGEGFCTQAGTLSKVLGMEDLVYNVEDLTALSPRYVNRDVTANSNTNVADVFVNINPQGHLKMQVGDSADITALRTWQVTNSTTANVYVDPDYHYTVLNLAGVEDSSVVKLDRYTTSVDPWVTLTAVGNGTAIVLVTYDALHAVQINKATATPYYGGADWSALWPENTGVFVVTVGNQLSGITTHMYANRGTNDSIHKLAVDALDAEHDVIYYLSEEGHANYTFTPEGVATVEIAYPTFDSVRASYTTFESVAKAADNSYTLQLRQGRQIVRLTNEAGIAEYQVITAKPCTREITNLTRPGEAFRAGDKVSVQYAGLFHPNNKLSRIYNMTAYVTYNGIPAGTSEYGSAGQYTFAAVPSAQLYKYNIPFDAAGEVKLQGGCIQINGFGDPVGNHRNLSRTEGRVFDGNAPSHKTYLGILPDVELDVEGLKHHTVVFNGLPQGSSVVVLNEEQDTLTADTNGNYDLVLGAFTYSIEAPNYAPLHSAFTVSLSQNDTINIAVSMTLATTAWDGTTSTEPALIDNYYQITSAAELVWLATTANASTVALNAVLTSDINLGGYAWTAIGTSANPYLGTFDGQGHTISGLYVNATTTYQGLFGKLKNGTIRNLNVEGMVLSTNTHAAGVVGGVEAGRVENVSFRGTVNTAKNNTAGIVGYVNGNNAAIVAAMAEGYIYGAAPTGGIVGNLSVATDTIRDSYNRAFVSGTGTVGGIAGTCAANAIIENVYNAGSLQMRSVTNSWGSTTTATTLGAICGLASYGKLENGYATIAYNNESNANNKTRVIGIDRCADGTLAHELGWAQQLGIDPYPVLEGSELFQLTIVEDTDTTITFTNATILPDTVWIQDIYGAYFNEAGQKVLTVNSDTTVYLLIEVLPLTGPATFEERTLRPNTAWYGDPGFVAGENAWNSGDYIFNTQVDDYSEWGYGIYYYDVTMANLTDTTFDRMKPYYDQYSAAGGAAEGQNYAVWYSNWYNYLNVTLLEPAVVSGMAITNTTWVIDAILHGDGMSVELDGSKGKPFGKGDWVKLRVTGYDEDEDPIDYVEFYLADFRDSITYDWTYAENWQWLDLTELGEVNYLGFSIMSSKHNSGGTTTPTYFCFDNLGGEATDCRLGELTHVHGELPTGVDGTSATMPEVRKVLLNGILYIIMPDGHRLDAQGRLVE